MALLASGSTGVELQILRYLIQQVGGNGVETQRLSQLLDEKQRQDETEQRKSALLEQRVQLLEQQLRQQGQQQGNGLHSPSSMSQAGQQATNDLMKGFSNAGLEILKMGTHQQTAAIAEQMAENMASKYAHVEIQQLRAELEKAKLQAESDNKQHSTLLAACERDLHDFSSALEAVNVELDEQKTRSEFLVNSRIKSLEDRVAEQLAELQSAFGRHEDWMNQEVVPSVNALDHRLSKTKDNNEEEKNTLQKELSELQESTAERTGEVDSRIGKLEEQLFGLKLEVLNAMNSSRDILKDFEEQEVQKTKTEQLREKDVRILANDLTKLKSTLLLAEEGVEDDPRKRLSFFTKELMREDESGEVDNNSNSMLPFHQQDKVNQKHGSQQPGGDNFMGRGQAGFSTSSSPNKQKQFNFQPDFLEALIAQLVARTNLEHRFSTVEDTVEKKNTKFDLQLTSLHTGFDEYRREVQTTKEQLVNLAEHFKAAFAHPMFSFGQNKTTTAASSGSTSSGDFASKNWNPLADPRQTNMPSLALPGIRSPTELGSSSLPMTSLDMISNGDNVKPTNSSQVVRAGADGAGTLASPPRSPRGNQVTDTSGTGKKVEVSGLFNSFEGYFTEKISHHVIHSFSDKIAQLQLLIEERAPSRKLEDLSQTTEHLAEGVFKLAQVTGVIPPKTSTPASEPSSAAVGVQREEHQQNQSTYSHLQEFDSWKERSRLLPLRIEKVWRARCANKCRNVLDMVAKKADLGLLKLLQQSVHDLELQMLSSRNQLTAYRMTTVPPMTMFPGKNFSCNSNSQQEAGQFRGHSQHQQAGTSGSGLRLLMREEEPYHESKLQNGTAAVSSNSRQFEHRSYDEREAGFESVYGNASRQQHSLPPSRPRSAHGVTTVSAGRARDTSPPNSSRNVEQQRQAARGVVESASSHYNNSQHHENAVESSTSGSHLRFGTQQQKVPAADPLGSTMKGLLEGPPPSHLSTFGSTPRRNYANEQQTNKVQNHQRMLVSSPHFGNFAGSTGGATASNHTNVAASSVVPQADFLSYSEQDQDPCVPSVKVNQMHPQRPQPTHPGRVLKMREEHY
ncbi:unnamed protein product [Amoebophrya sp. A120]|nr:unnamed protein product [Amoebophrya sp. A120]|eukprot:GSA120T00011566001.1